MNIPLIVFNDVTGQYISAIESQRGNVSVARHVQDMSELLGISQTGIVRAALFVGGLDQITVSSIAMLQSYGIAVVILRDPEDDVRLGHEHIVSTLADTDEIIETIEWAVSEGVEVFEKETYSETKQHDKLLPEEDTVDDEPSRNGKIVVFWGSSGSPGRSSLAVQFSAYAAEQNYRVCLLDADTYNPSIGGILGITEDYSTFSQLAHYAEKGNLTRENFKTTTSTIKHGKNSFDVATGITSADRWPEIRQSAFERMLLLAQEIYDFVLVDVNNLIEADEEISFEGIVPLRNGCTITALEKADYIFAIGSADALGIPRILKALDSLEESKLAHPAVKVYPWINKVRAQSIGSKPEQQIDSAWTRYSGKYPIAGFTGWDPELFDKLLLTGQTVFEINRKHTIVASIEQMFQKVMPSNTATREFDVNRHEETSVIVQRTHPKSKKSFTSNLFARKSAKSR